MCNVAWDNTKIKLKKYSSTYNRKYRLDAVAIVGSSCVPIPFVGILLLNIYEKLGEIPFVRLNQLSYIVYKLIKASNKT